MRSDSAPAYTAAIVAAGAALVFYSVTAPDAPPWPTPETIGASGQMLIDAISRVPFGEQATRAITLAVVMGSISSAINAWIIARGGLPVSLAVGCTLTLAFSPAVWHQATSDAPGSVAAVLVACAVAISLVQPPSRIRIVGATAAVIVGLFLQPPFRGHDTSWAVALQTLRREWLLPVIVIMCMAIAAPVWRAIPPPRLVILGALAFVVLGAIGYDVAPLVVFPALLLAEGVRLLPLSSARAKTAVVLALAALAGVDRWYATDPHEWRVLAWRDAVERAVPPGATIFTGSRAAAALNGPLFQQRPSRIRIAFESDVDANEARGSYVLNDRHDRVVAAGVSVDPVPVRYATPLDALGRLPQGTIVGLAISAASAAAEPGRVREALALLGQQPAEDRAKPVIAVGAIGAAPRDATHPTEVSQRLHILMGDPIERTGLRSPADFELRASIGEVSVRLDGQVLGEGSGWATIALDPGGPLIEAMASDYRTQWPVRVPGLELWKANVDGADPSSIRARPR